MTQFTEAGMLQNETCNSNIINLCVMFCPSYMLFIALVFAGIFFSLSSSIYFYSVCLRLVEQPRVDKKGTVMLHIF